jgi:hypothetical protein
MNATIESFSGVDLKTESTELPSAPSMPLRRAEGALLTPVGALSRTPPYERPWGLTNLRSYMGTLGLVATDNGVCILARNEGIMFLLFYDCFNQQSLGSIYAGKDPESTYTGPLTLTAGGAELQVLWKGLACQYRWTGKKLGTEVAMGNGFDPNLVLETSSPVTIRPQNDQMRPLMPIVAMLDPEEGPAQNATVQAGNVLFTALEPGFQPEYDPPYRRDYGNYVKLSVVQSGYSYFTSSLSGTGTAIDPFIYTVLCPMTLPTEDELVNFITKDPSAQGVMSASLTGAAATVILFPPAALTGGVAQFLPTDVFAGPYAAACLTYCKKGAQASTFAETMPSQIATCQLSDGGRLSVTINQDTAGYVARYDTIRIYVADMSLKTFGLAANYYTSFLFALEVPNAPGTYSISPAMLQPGTILSVEGRTVPPCSMFEVYNGRLHMSGNPDFPLRRWFTRATTITDLVPEGTGIFDYIDHPATVVGDAVVALGLYRGEGVAFCKQKAYPFDTTGTTQRYSLLSGPINNRTTAVWSNGAQYYLARDFNIYTLTQPVTDAKSEQPDFNLPAPQIGNYLQQYVDLTDTHFAHSVVDTLNKSWWIWLRNVAGGMSAFVLNFETNQLTGPFDYPQLMCAEFLEDGDTRMVGMDVAGNLFFMDVKALSSIGEPFANTTGITLHNAADMPDSPLDGFGIASLNLTGTTQYVRRANIIRIQSPWLNFADAVGRKAFYSVSWQVIQNSAGLVWVACFNETGQSVVRYYGDVFGRKLPPRVALRIKGNLLQFLMIVLVGDDLPFAIRNVTIGYEPMGDI